MSRITTTDTPQDNSNPDTALHTLSIYVNNKAGVLMRITQVFARRGFNIDSLVVSQSRDARYSRMTIGITGSSNGREQIIKQVSKLVDVIHCHEHTTSNAIVKEMLLIKFLVDAKERTEALQIIDHFGGKSIDLTPESMTAIITGDPGKIDASINMLSVYKIVETVRTGKVVIARGSSPT
jgi:acetolactate synthase I/III small subunit